MGDGVHRGELASQMGDNLPYVDLGTGRTVTSISVGAFFRGSNNHGDLGQGDTMWRGNMPGQMGDALLPVPLW
jgi:hypothetical protein